VHICAGAPLYGPLPLFVTPLPPPILAICHFSTNCRTRSRLLCCRLRAALTHRLARGGNLPPPADCISGRRAQELVLVLLKNHAAQRAPVFPAPRRVYEIPPPPPCAICRLPQREGKCAPRLLPQPPMQPLNKRNRISLKNRISPCILLAALPGRRRRLRIRNSAVQHSAPRLRAAAVEVAHHLNAVRVAAAVGADIALLREIQLARRASLLAHVCYFSLGTRHVSSRDIAQGMRWLTCRRLMRVFCSSVRGGGGCGVQRALPPLTSPSRGCRTTTPRSPNQRPYLQRVWAAAMQRRRGAGGRGGRGGRVLGVTSPHEILLVECQATHVRGSLHDDGVRSRLDILPPEGGGVARRLQALHQLPHHVRRVGVKCVRCAIQSRLLPQPRDERWPRSAVVGEHEHVAAWRQRLQRVRVHDGSEARALHSGVRVVVADAACPAEHAKAVQEVIGHILCTILRHLSQPRAMQLALRFKCAAAANAAPASFKASCAAGGAPLTYARCYLQKFGTKIEWMRPSTMCQHDS
jgi:hypothetical protein